MSTLFDDLETTLLHTLNVSPKESLEDMGLDEEERDKIVHSVSSSLNISDLNVDYSDFSNHIFFGSGYAAANFALTRIIRDYPTDGELKEKNEWRKANSGYENWFFDNHPKQQGFLSVTSGSTGWVALDDYEKKISFNSASLLGSFTIEAIIQSWSGIPDLAVLPIVTIEAPGNDFMQLSIRGATGSATPKPKRLSFDIMSGGVQVTATASYVLYASQSNHVAVTYNRQDNNLKLYINGNIATSTSLGVLTGVFNHQRRLEIGHSFLASVGSPQYFTGGIDDVRIWSTARSPELIKRNYFRAIHANHTGGLELYYKFNQPSEYGTKIVDYSGNGLHGILSGGDASVSANLKSGTLGAWFKDPGDPILALNNSRVDAFITDQRTSGSNFDDQNQSMIFNLVPASFTEDDNTEYQQLFLLLTARHFDRLKLYIEHLSNVLKTKPGKYDGTPSNLLDLAAKHYGFDVGNIYSGGDALQYFYGENVLSSGSLDSSIETVKIQLKRNILSNLAYILKTKSTQESIKATLRALGLNDIVTVSEYTDFSGGIQTTFSPNTVERYVAKFFTSSNVYISSSAYASASTNLYQVRALFNTASVHLSQSIFSIEEQGSLLLGARVHRSNLTASDGKLVMNYRTAAGALLELTSSTYGMFDNKWVNFSITRDPTSISSYISSMDRSGLLFSQSSTNVVVGSTGTLNTPSLYLGSSGSNKFDGHMHEFRGWDWANGPTANQSFEKFARWGLDWELTEIPNPLVADYDRLKVHLKLNDLTASSTSGGPIHNYANGLSGSSYLWFSTSAESNFPGKYIDKFDINHTYDLNVDNDKIRIRQGSEFNDKDANIDIPFVSIDFSPVISLNKEIMKWIGDISKFSNFAGDTLNAYRDENYDLDLARRQFFASRINSRIDFGAFRNLIRWFDSNFGYLLQQLIPLDIASSISNYVIEPHILEFNKVKKTIGASASGRSTALEAGISLFPVITASSNGSNLGLADPGRFGAFVSASAEVSIDAYINYASSSGSGLNFQRYQERRVVDNVLRDNLDGLSPVGYGNGFYTKIITGSNYLKNTLNVNSNFCVSGVYYMGGGPKGTQFLSSSHGEPISPYTGTFNGVQDARWLWMVTNNSGGVSVIDEGAIQHRINYGIGYGGLWGQLRSRNFRSFAGKPLYPPGSTDGTPSQISQIGEGVVSSKPPFSDYIQIFNDANLRTLILWPTLNSYDGARLFANSSSVMTATFADNTNAAVFGEPIDIEGYNTINFEILTRAGHMDGTSSFTQLGYEIKFQFFSKDTPGDRTFETVMSASRHSNTYKQKAVPVAYEFETEAYAKGQLLDFTFNFERSLPKQKYMRVFITPKVNVGTIGSYTTLVKGVLSNQKREVDDLPIRVV